METVREDIVYAPMKGRAVPLCNINDPVFSQEILGEGIAIEPTEGRVVAPVDGEITMIFKARHAITLETPSGLEVLIHVGLDTVNLKGEFYKVYAKTGDKVKVGDLLAEVDLQGITDAGYKSVTPVIISNMDRFKEVNILKVGLVEELDRILLVR